MRMDKRGITVVQIKIPNIVLRSSSAQSCSCDRRLFNHFHRSLIERNPAGRGRICRIGNGQNPVPNGIRQKRYRQTAQHHKSRDQPRLPQKYHYDHGTGHSYPACPGIGHAQGRCTNDKHTACHKLAPPMAGAENQCQNQRQQQNQDLGKCIGVIKVGLHTSRHPRIHRDIHIGLIHFHALDALIHTIQR